MKYQRWLIRDIALGSTLFVWVVPKGAVARNGSWFEPDVNNPLRNSPQPDEVWTNAMLSSGVNKPLARAGRYFADLDIRPKASGSADVHMRIEAPDGSVVAVRSASGVTENTAFSIFVYVN